MTKQEHIDYWVKTANRDWITVRHMFASKDYVPALFFSHLIIEKLLKAHWVKDHAGNHPPKIHNLVSLANAIKYKFSLEEFHFLDEMNNFQIEGRYPDYRDKLYKTYKHKETEATLEKVNIIRECLLKNLL